MKHTKFILPEKWWFIIPQGKEKEVEKFADDYYKENYHWANSMSTHRIVYNPKGAPVLTTSPNNGHVEISYKEFEIHILKKSINYQIYY